MLLESILILFQFKNFGLLKRRNHIFLFITGAYTIIWFVQNFIISSIFYLNVFFTIIYSVVTIILSLECINNLIGTSGKIVKNATFLLCVAFIFYFTVDVLTFAFWWYGLDINDSFLLRVDVIVVYVNLFTNIIYALAVLWMPKKIPYLLPF